MAIRIDKDKIVFPDGTEQVTAGGGTPPNVYTKSEVDAQQNAQDVNINKNTTDIANVYTKAEVNAQQQTQDVEIATKLSDAPDDGETYARNNKTWVSISDTSGIPDAPVDGEMYGRKDGEWSVVADSDDVYTKTETNNLLDDKADKSTTYTKSEVDLSQQSQDSLIQANADAIANLPTPVDTYTKAEIDASQNAQDTLIQKNADDIANIPAPVDTYTKSEIDAQQETQDTEIETNATDIADNKLEIAQNAVAINANTIAINDKADKSNTYTKTETNTLLDSKANVGDSYLKNETYTNTEIDTKLFTKADKSDTYTKDEVNELIEVGSGAIVGNYKANYPGNVARDPEAGNLYLVDTMSFTNNYDEVTTLYISTTDADGTVRDLSQIADGDVINLESANGSGSYTIQSFSDAGAYFEIIVDRGNCTGTLAQDDDVTARLKVTGGDYTPEAMVWEDKKSERAFNTEYTNNNNVPIYLSVNTTYKADGTSSAPYLTLYINGEKFGSEGLGYTSVTGDTTDSSLFQTTTFVVPAGNTYELRAFNDTTLNQWKEAKMPVAVGTGGGSGGDSVWEVTGGGNAKYDGAVISTSYYKSADDGLQLRDGAVSVSRVDNDLVLSTANTERLKIGADGSVDLGTPELEQKLNVYNIGTSKYGFGGIPYYARMYFPSDGNLQFGTMSKDGTDTFTSLMQLSNGGAVTTNADMFVNGIRVGQGGGAYALPENTVLGVDVLAGNVSGTGNTGIGSSALRFNTAGGYNTAVGLNAVNKENGGRNTAVGSNALGACTGTGNTSIGESAGSASLSGNNNTMLGSGAQPSAPDVSNEVTIGNGDVAVTRLRGNLNLSKTGAENFGAINLNGSGGTASSLGFVCNDYEGFWLDGQGRFRSPSIRDNTTVSPANIYINPDNGQIERSTTSLYTAEEVDKKLAIKDKLIEKLSARLDELEKRLK